MTLFLILFKMDILRYILKNRKKRRFLEVFMDLNNRCNLKCIMCHFSKDTSNIPSNTMSLKIFTKIAKDIFPKTSKLHLSCSAEPLLIPNLDEYLKIVKRYSIPHTVLVTNSILLKKGMISDIIDNDISELEVSIDA